MGRAILEILLAVLLAAAATLALVWGLENKALKQDLNKAIAALKAYKAKVEELETELATKEAEHAKAPDTAHAGGKAHWGYEGEMGPAKWGDAYPLCGTGKAQSPIDIRGPFEKGTAAIKLDYKPSPLKILNNGHTVQVNVDPGSKLTTSDGTFQLLQFHFHKSSEELIDGKPSAMVAHFVHKSDDGKLAVVGVLINEGAENPLIKQLWSHAPTKEGPEVAVAGASIDPKGLMPAKLNYYAYDGSLTTPPCTEGVRFYILKEKMTVSKEQLAAFPFKANARPVQPLNGRKITLF